MGAFISRFVEGDETHLSSITDFDFGNDGHIYVLNTNAGPVDDEAVLQYDGSGGGFLDVFVTSVPGPNRLERPVFIEFARSRFVEVPSIGSGGWVVLVAVISSMGIVIHQRHSRDAEIRKTGVPEIV